MKDKIIDRVIVIAGSVSITFYTVVAGAALISYVTPPAPCDIYTGCNPEDVY